MPRYWVIAPFDSQDPEVWDAVWNFDLQYGIISIGWAKVGDPSSLTESQIREKITSIWPNQAPNAATQAARTIHKFYNEVKAGDFVIARWGRKHVASVGKVVRPGHYDPLMLKGVFEEFGPDYLEIAYPNHLGVEWNANLQDYGYDKQIFGLTTLYEIPDEMFRWLTEEDSAPLNANEPDETPEIIQQAEFILERYLEEFIVSNFHSIFQGRLSVLTDSQHGTVGQQYQTDEVGIIDILAQDVESGDFVVIELKKGRQADKVVGQILRYMGWVSNNLCKDGQNVRGVIICREPDPKLKYAIQMTNNVSVKYYHIDFKLTDNPIGNFDSNSLRHP